MPASTTSSRNPSPLWSIQRSKCQYCYIRRRYRGPDSYREVNCCGQIGLLTVDDERFCNTLEADQFLALGKAYYMGDQNEAFTGQWRGISKAAESIRTGKAQDKVDFSSMSSEELDQFYRGSYSQTRAAGRQLATRYDFPNYRSLLDVGGRTGGIATGLTEAHSQLQATVADFASVIPVPQKFIDEAGVSDRPYMLSL